MVSGVDAPLMRLLSHAKELKMNDYRSILISVINGFLVLGISSHAAAATDAMARDGETYVLTVRDMEILHDVDTDDRWSPAPDLVVRIGRTDPEVSREIGRLEKANDRRKARQRKVEQARDDLLDQREKSAEKPVEPLTDTQMERLKALLVEVGYMCSKSQSVCRRCPEEGDFDTCYACAKCPELELLQWRKSDSERFTVPPLTERQLRRLEDYEEEAGTLAEEIAATGREVASLRRLIFGSSRKIETSSRIVDFGDRDIIKIYPDDEIKVSVWDDDVFRDDLYGRATVTIDRATLERGTLDVSMPNIKFVRLKFRRDESASVPQ